MGGRGGGRRELRPLLQIKVSSFSTQFINDLSSFCGCCSLVNRKGSLSLKFCKHVSMIFKKIEVVTNHQLTAEYYIPSYYRWIIKSVRSPPEWGNFFRFSAGCSAVVKQYYLENMYEKSFTRAELLQWWNFTWTVPVRCTTKIFTSPAGCKKLWKPMQVNFSS